MIFEQFKNKLKTYKDEISMKHKNLKYNKNPEYYRRIGLNEYLEPEIRQEILVVVPKNFHIAHNEYLQVEEITDYNDTSSKMMKLKGTSYYLNKYQDDEYTIEVPVKFYSQITAKKNELEETHGDKIRIKKTKDGCQISGRSKELKKYVIDMIYPDFMMF